MAICKLCRSEFVQPKIERMCCTRTCSAKYGRLHGKPIYPPLMYGNIDGKCAKRCTKCLKYYILNEFWEKSTTSDGLETQCIYCCRLRSKVGRNNNLEQFKASRKKYYQKNIEKMRAEKIQYGLKHKKDKAAYDTTYRDKNKNKIAKYKREWNTRYTKTNIQHRLKKNLRRRVHHALSGHNKSAHTMELIGCDIDFFKKHIESQWQEGMSWENYGTNGWHIDHIKPCYSFDLSQESQQKECFHYSNQRPLWAKDNLTRPRIKYIL